jgi:flagellar biosynthesis activator protein FlaF
VSTSNFAQTAYQQITAPIRTARGTEYEVLARITHSLNKANLSGKAGFPDLVSALHDNRQLWSTFAVDVADPQNGLPQDLRAKIFFLAEFTLAHTSKILSGSAKVAPLIEINTAIMAGLRGQGQGQKA